MRSVPWLLVLLLGAAVCCVGCGSSSSAKKTPPGPATVKALHTMPGTSVPILSVTHAAQGVAPGYVFVAQKGGG